MATKARVAFHTISVTSITSLNPTTPTSKAITAPPHADHPIDNPLGCQITKTSVIKKMAIAKTSVDDNIFPSRLTTNNSCTLFLQFFQMRSEERRVGND